MTVTSSSVYSARLQRTLDRRRGRPSSPQTLELAALDPVAIRRAPRLATARETRANAVSAFQAALTSGDDDSFKLAVVAALADVPEAVTALTEFLITNAQILADAAPIRSGRRKEIEPAVQAGWRAARLTAGGLARDPRDYVLYAMEDEIRFPRLPTRGHPDTPGDPLGGNTSPDVTEDPAPGEERTRG